MRANTQLSLYLILLINVDLKGDRTGRAAPIVLPSPAQWGSACMLFIFASTLFSEMAEIAGFAPGPILSIKPDRSTIAVSVDKTAKLRKQARTALEKALAALAEDAPQIAALLMELTGAADRDQVLRALRKAVKLMASYDRDDCLRRVLCFLAAGQNEMESIWIEKVRKTLRILDSGTARSYLVAMELGNSTGSVNACSEVYAVCNLEAEQVALYMLSLRDRS